MPPIDPPKSRREAMLRVAMQHASRVKRKAVVLFLIEHDPTRPERAYEPPSWPNSDPRL